MQGGTVQIPGFPEHHGEGGQGGTVASAVSKSLGFVLKGGARPQRMRETFSCLAAAIVPR